MSADRAVGKKSVDAEQERLRSIIEECEARLTEIADLVSRVRHEINNPLTGVLGQAQLLLREELNDKARKRAETIESLARRLTDIVAELRQVQRPPKAVGATPTTPSASS